MKYLVVGDIHWTATLPYHTGLVRLFTWLVKRYGDHTLIQTGDWYDSTHEDWEAVIDTATGFLLQFPEAHLVTGNHDVNFDRRRRLGNALLPLTRHPTVKVYASPKANVKIGTYQWLFLPYLKGFGRNDEAYTDFRGTGDFAVAHLARPGQGWGKDEYALKGLAARDVFLGHIHEPYEEIEGETCFQNIGVPQMTKNGEQHHEPQLFTISDTGVVSRVVIPRFLRVEEVAYGDTPEDPESNLVAVIDAPSLTAIREKYGKYHLLESACKVERDTIGGLEVAETLASSYDLGSLPRRFHEFLLTRKVPTEYAECIKGYLG